MLAYVAKRQYCIVLITRRLSRIQFSPKPINISGANFFYLASDSPHMILFSFGSIALLTILGALWYNYIEKK